MPEATQVGHTGSIRRAELNSGLSDTKGPVILQAFQKGLLTG